VYRGRGGELGSWLGVNLGAYLLTEFFCCAVLCSVVYIGFGLGYGGLASSHSGMSNWGADRGRAGLPYATSSWR
jgi:hypothetical protein